MSVRWAMRLLFLCTSLPGLASGPTALLSNCSQVLADQLRLNKILTEVNLRGQDICDEKAKAPAGQTAASRAEGAGVASKSTYKCVQ